MQMLYLLAETAGDVSLGETLKWISTLGGTSILAGFCWLWIKGSIVTRRELDDANSRAAEWQKIALRSVNNNERSVGAVERTAELVDKVVSRTNPTQTGDH